MKKLSTFFWILNLVWIVAGLVIFAAAASAQQISYESAAVGRIVGETPEEMRGQLVADEIELDYATYYGDNSVILTSDISRAKDVVSVVQQKFPDSNDAHFVESLTLGRWDWDDVKDSIGSWAKRSLLLLEAHGDVKEGVVTADSPAYFDETVSIGDFDWDFNGKPLVVFDSDYAGVNVPKRGTFVSAVAGDAVVIAPTAVPDKNFVKVFACNLGKYKTLGETYTNARNNYYWQSNKPSGIALMSYELYGNPASLVSVPDYDEAAISGYCGDFLKNYGEGALSPALAVSSLSDGAELDLENDVALPLRESRRFSIADYSVADSGDFSVLVAGGTMLSSDDGDLVLPVASLVQTFPLKTVVTGVDNVKFSNPVDFTVPNLPSWAGGFVERECSYESRNASLETRHAMDGNRLELFTTIRPVEVVNCSEGMLRLYTEIGFDVNYFSYSPVLMREVTVLDSAAPGEELSAGVTLANIRGGSFSGELTLSEGSRIIAEKAVEFAGENELVTALPFKAGSNEGTSQYVLAFVQNGEEKAFYGFSLRVRSIDVSLHAPVTAGESGSVRLIVYNHLPVPVESTIGSFLAKGTGILSESTETTLQPGVNEIPLPYYGLNREDERYDFLVAVPYGEGKATASTVLVTNHPPLLKQISPLTVVEGETVKLSPEAADVDGDEVLITYSGELSEGEWQTERGDAGSYEVSVTASDGLLSASQTVGIIVLADEDYDDDGYDSEVDCNDEDALINPGAAEICDALDNNCDGNVDEDACSSQASPDLKVEEITFTPPAPVAGEAVTFTAVIKNVGDASAADIAVASSVNCSGYGWSGGTAPIQVALAPGEVYSYAFSYVFNAEDACTVTMRVSAGGDSNPDNDQGSISLGIGLPITCTDSDGGQEYGIKGAATSSSRDIEGRIDCCKLQHSTFAGDSVAHIGPGGGPCTAEAPYLYEAVCGEDKMPTMVVYRCPNGCNNGACVENNVACQKLLEKVKASYLKACGEAGYDPVADVNKDSRVNALDVSLLSANSNNPVWCSNAHSSTNMPCSAGGGWPPAAKSCPGLESGQQSYFDICKSNGYDNVCFNKYSGEYQGCTRSSNNDCTIGNANAAQNILCNVS